LAACEPAPQPVAAAAPKPPEQPRTFVLFFGFDSARLMPEAKAVLHEAAMAAKARANARIVCVGHTDTSGANAYNLALSQRRGEAVKQALVQEGIAPDAIQVSGRGEEALSVSTRDNIRESQNRRVEVTIQ
jgi:outer membrane protein OmpA-like peptidoglycan-associated protein